MNDYSQVNGMSRSTFALESFRNVQELIRFIDQKASAILVVYGLILTVFLEFIKRISYDKVFGLNNWGQISLSLALLIVGVTLIFLLVYQLYYIIMQILRPRLAMNYKEDDHAIFYFEHIAEMKKKDLLKKYITATEEIMVEEIVGQLYEVSKIMKTKTYRLKRVMKFLFINILLLLLFIIISTIMQGGYFNWR